MDPLLAALRELHIRGTKGEELAFEELKQQTVRELKENERRVLEHLVRHHPPTWKHSFMVMHDAVWLAERLGLSADDVQAIRLAALCHDVGKLDIHPLLLDLPRSDHIAICKKKHGRVLPGKLTKQFTLYDMILYLAAQAPNQQAARKLIRNFEQWLRERKLDDFLHRSAYEYLVHHQEASARILREYGIDGRIIRYAATHHPEYLDAAKRKAAPRYAQLITIADKFNAMIQSEGVRPYANRLLRVEALTIILHELKQDFHAGVFHSFARRALAELAARHLPSGIVEELVPRVERSIGLLRRALKTQSFSPDAQAVREAQRLAAAIVAVLTLCDELHVTLEHHLLRTLDEYEEELLRLSGTVFHGIGTSVA
ncbi:HD domain-containing protein [Candidatus Woesearchaeota archaeon]|nr:MAG: HD domain-containing protein [Candidatus Woesearchaeota archaeon]